jgi:two-component system NtrC family sensor kinase
MLTQGVIHDLKTHLHSLLTATELVKEQVVNEKKRADRLERLFRACATNLPKMRRIIELTLDGSRDIPIRPVEKDILETLRGAAETNQPLASLRGVTVKIDTPRDSLTVRHDPVQLERAFTNLIRNGIEAFESREQAKRPNGKLLRISVAPNKESGVEILFEDSGPGLNGFEEAAFAPLRSTKAHGAGLGLYVTKKIVHGHGGTITAGASPSLKGACFRVRLPAPSANVAEGPI